MQAANLQHTLLWPQHAFYVTRFLKALKSHANYEEVASLLVQVFHNVLQCDVNAIHNKDEFCKLMVEKKLPIGLVRALLNDAYYKLGVNDLTSLLPTVDIHFVRKYDAKYANNFLFIL